MSEMPKEEIEELMVQLERYVKKHWILPIGKMIGAMRSGKTREEIISEWKENEKKRE
jgi:hypothetical protein